MMTVYPWTVSTSVTPDDILDMLADLDDNEQAELAATLRNVLDELPPAASPYDAALRNRCSEIAALLD